MSDHVAVITRTIRPGKEAEFEQAMEEFALFSRQCSGHLHLRLLRDSEHPSVYTVVTQFEDEASRQAFKANPAYAVWMEKLGALSAEPPRILEHRGLAGFFPPPANRAVPPRWKMALITWIGVWPLSTAMGHLTSPLQQPVRGAVTSGLIVLGLSFVVLPLLNRLFRNWLFPPGKETA